MNSERVTIGPLTIHAIHAEELTLRLAGAMRAGRKTHHVVTANAQFYNLAEQRKDFRECLAGAEYVCADGISVVLACKLLENRKVFRIAGVDLVDHLSEQVAALGLTAYFLGGKEGSGELAAAALTKKYPGFQVAISCPPFGFEKDPERLAAVLNDVRRVSPAVIFVALGAPRQEIFIRDHIRPLNVPVAVGVGGSFEMIGGRVRRAPAWIQRSGFEWAYRWAQEPVRLTERYLIGNALFCMYVGRHLIRKRFSRQEPCLNQD